MFFRLALRVLALGLFTSPDCIFSEAEKISPIEKSETENNIDSKENTQKIKEHSAEYKISVIKNKNPDISDAAGSLTIVVKESNGYISEQHAILKVRYNDGSEEEYETFLASWESKDGKEYHFNLKTTQNKEEEISIRGKGSLTQKAGEVIYQIPEGQRVNLPQETLFPIGFLTQLLTSAHQGKTSDNSVVFDGSNETFSVINVESAMHPTKPKIKINGCSEINFDDCYHLQMAVYDPKDKDMDPVYVTSQVIQKDGIIISMEMEFPEIGFTTKAQLVKVNL